ncbi:O-methyltransferase [Pseudonocardia sp. MH-G8]|uniref:O-methyltransferase n=1 Tax=Pseudonocardia sp. MH-G8 TaxID=1854588 RepID=UPI000BA0C9C1|nr:O-methyltransferase [Pseudonocardia sp. MH-G8]OZM80035.1 methyltransferase [Pseudonocardia sp. MH-G8]
MTEVWGSVDEYFTGQLLAPDPVLDAALEANALGGLPTIDVSPAQGKLLHLLARSVGARRILEVGTLGGYSTIWLARALPADGQLVTCELDPHHAEVARSNLARAGLDEVVDVRVGSALDTLPTLEGPFDLAFIDADKASNAEYFRHALRLSRPGSMIVVDNVVRGGRVVEADSHDPSIRGTREVTETIAAEPRVDATIVQTVGTKGYDGLLLAIVN